MEFKNKQMLKLKIIIIIVAISISKITLSQQLYLPLGETYRQQVSYEINKNNFAINTGFKPLLKSDVNKIVKIDSVLYDFNRRKKIFSKHKENWFWRALLFDNFVTVEKENFNLYVNPLFYVELGKLSQDGVSDEDYFINTRAIEIKGDIGKKLSFYSSFRENQAKFQPYIYNWSWNRLVVPGQGALKKNNSNISTFDFSSASAYLSYTPNNWLNVQIGQDKNFIGEGHRSLLLSDNSTNYPFAKFSFTYKSFKYVTMFTEFRDFSGAYYRYHTKKHGAFNYLSYNYKNRFEIGFFEGVIYQTTDTTAAYYNKFNVDYFVPIIGVRTAVNGLASNNNVLLGLNAKLKVTNFIQAYGQLAIDDAKQGKTAYQTGLKIFDVFYGKLKGHNLFFQAEYNLANPRTYSHSNLKYQTWSHYNQELAHPAGSDFMEYLFNAKYSFKSFFVEYSYRNLNLNNKNTFSDIYMLDNFSYLMMPQKVNIIHNTIIGAFVINKRTNLQIYAGVDFRKETENNIYKNSQFIMFGLRTSLNNFYYDF